MYSKYNSIREHIKYIDYFVTILLLVTGCFYDVAMLRDIGEDRQYGIWPFTKPLPESTVIVCAI